MMHEEAVVKLKIENKASRNPGSAGILPALLSKTSHPLKFIISWTIKKVMLYIFVWMNQPLLNRKKYSPASFWIITPKIM